MLKGKCALVTGSTAGLGYAMAAALAKEGADVVVHGLATEEEGQEVAAGLAARFRTRVLFDRTDLSDVTAIERMILRIGQELTAPDIVVNNAVVRHFHAIEDFPTDDWNDSLAVNISAAFHLARLTLPQMKARAWGRIINISSIYGSRGAKERIDYVTTKTALLGMARAIAIETAGTGITCNAVCPGSVPTPAITERIRKIAESQRIPVETASRNYVRERQPSGEFVDPDDVGAMIAFLCGPHSGNITGSSFQMDGGWLAA